MSTSSKGKHGEDEAEKYLLKEGHTILVRNFRKHLGEIDIISQKGETLYFSEVKNWEIDFLDTPLQIFNKKKISKMRKLAELFLVEKGFLSKYYVSFCLLYIQKGEIIFYKDLF
ncbi:MAG: YraN family protein [Leptospiraceae bacterium]|nr:YraN family protein [Leptospiraceae bacterium]MCP5500863.1 YraN family protein [Leptospiraceae bacterium]